MSTKPDDIKAALKTLFETIKVANGYINTIGSVSTEYVAAAAATMPAIVVFNSDLSIEDMPGDMAEVSQRFNLYLIVKEEVTPQADLNSLLSDVIEALAKDYTLGGKCIRFMVHKAAMAGDVVNVPGFPPGLDPPYAYMRVECEALYEFLQTSGLA